MQYYRSTEYKCIFYLLFYCFAFLELNPCFPVNKTRWIDSPNWPALRSPQIELPKRPAILVRQKELPLWSTKTSRHFGPPNWVAIYASQLDPPVYPPPPAQNSQAGHGPLAAPPLPPAPSPCNGEERGRGWGPARPARASQTGTFILLPLTWLT